MTLLPVHLILLRACLGMTFTFLSMFVLAHRTFQLILAMILLSVHRILLRARFGMTFTFFTMLDLTCLTLRVFVFIINVPILFILTLVRIRFQGPLPTSAG
eukprot:GEMP01122266.1.p3 GENE.GEMP01122266.1~~GEMP01122266.1.p3  ORF type:complete len:101 (-),score=5.79 GEMP01122266.1:289-591(-)